MTNSQGAIVDQYKYTAYGAPVTTSGTDYNPFRFGGQFGYFTIPSLGVINCGLRWYDPQQARWFSRDPIGYAGSANLYSYCGEDPVNLIDPSGLESIGARISNAIGAPFRFIWGKLRGAFSVKMDPNAPTLRRPYLNPELPESYEINGRYPVAGREISNYIDRTASGAIQDVALAGLGKLTNAERMANVRQVGAAGETACIATKNTTRIPSVTGTAKYRIPDELIKDLSLLKDAKNVGYLPYSRQIRDFIGWAEAHPGWKVELVVRKGTVVSPRLLPFINSGLVVVTHNL